MTIIKSYCVWRYALSVQNECSKCKRSRGAGNRRNLVHWVV